MIVVVGIIIVVIAAIITGWPSCDPWGQTGNSTNLEG